MATVIEHRGKQAIDALRLVWQYGLGQTRHAHFTQTCEWFLDVTVPAHSEWSPVVFEARHRGDLLGLLPMLENRSGTLRSAVFGQGRGHAAPIGPNPSLTWLEIAGHARKRPRPCTLELGPFMPGTGAAIRAADAMQFRGLTRVARRQSKGWKFNASEGNLASAAPRLSDEVRCWSAIPDRWGGDGVESCPWIDLLRARSTDPIGRAGPRIGGRATADPLASWRHMARCGQAGAIAMGPEAKPDLVIAYVGDSADAWPVARWSRSHEIASSFGADMTFEADMWRAALAESGLHRLSWGPTERWPSGPPATSDDRFEAFVFTTSTGPRRIWDRIRTRVAPLAVSQMA